MLEKVKFLIPLMLILLIIDSNAQIQRPQFPIEPENFVNPAIAYKVAKKMACNILGDHIILSEPIYCSDVRGILNTSIFIARRGDFFPLDDEILREIREGIEYEKKLREGIPITEINLLIRKEDIISELTKLNFPVYRPDGELSMFYKQMEKRKMIELILRKRFGNEDYISIYVSASFNDVPVPYIKKSLPPFYYSYEIALNEAQKYFGNPNVRLSRYYFLGLWGEFFEFINDENKVLIIDARKIAQEIKRDKSGVIIPSSLPKIYPIEGRDIKRIKSEWDKLITN